MPSPAEVMKLEELREERLILLRQYERKHERIQKLQREVLALVRKLLKVQGDIDATINKDSKGT